MQITAINIIDELAANNKLCIVYIGEYVYNANQEHRIDLLIYDYVCNIIIISIYMYLVYLYVFCSAPLFCQFYVDQFFCIISCL